MSEWHRIQADAVHHHKISKLSKKIGLTKRDAFGLMTAFWGAVCARAEDGDLSTWDDDDIALAALYDGDAAELVEAMHDVNLIDWVKDHWEVHNWGRYNPRMQATARQRKYRERQKKINRDVTVTSRGRHGDVTVTDTYIQTDRHIPMSKSETDSDLSGSIRQVWDHYRTYHPSAAKTLKSGRKEYRQLKARLEEFDVDQLKRCIDGYEKSPFHTGENERGAKYLSAELFFRSASHVQRGIEFADGFGIKTTRKPKPLVTLDT